MATSVVIVEPAEVPVTEAVVSVELRRHLAAIKHERGLVAVIRAVHLNY